MNPYRGLEIAEHMDKFREADFSAGDAQSNDPEGVEPVPDSDRCGGQIDFLLYAHFTSPSFDSSWLTSEATHVRWASEDRPMR